MPSKTASPKPPRPQAAVPVQTWKLQDAKARFSEVCRLAAEKGPQRITRQGKEAMIILPEKQFDRIARKTKGKSLYEVLTGARGTNLVIERDRSMLRDIDL